MCGKFIGNGIAGRCLLLAVGLAALVMASSAGSMDIVRDGAPKATIVVPDAALPVVRAAAEELQYHIHKATSAKLPIVPEAQKPDAGSLISIGATGMADAAGLKATPAVPNSFTIKLAGETLYFIGDDSAGEPFGILHNNRTRVGTLFAVYEFLEKQLGVRWLWPGELGEIIPPTRDVIVKDWDQEGKPAMVHTRWRDGSCKMDNSAGWNSPEAHAKFIQDQSKWLRRHRFAMGVNMDVRHSFTGWWQEYGTTHPEFFNLLPDGTRRPDPTHEGGAPIHVAMCISEPSLPKEIVERFVRTWKPGQPFYLDASENDTDGRCVCDRCMAWDVPDPELAVPFDQRKAKAVELFNRKQKDWDKEALGSLSDRYCRFWLAVQTEAQKHDPNAVVMFHGYGNYRKPPLKVKLNDRLLNSFVPGFYFPWTAEAERRFRSDWLGWRGAGCSMILRPNYLDCGHNMPIFYADKFGLDFNFAWTNGMIATDYDVLTGQYAAQGPNNYVVARLNNNPAMPAHLALDEYYAGFGKAREEVIAYFKHWRKVSDDLTDEKLAEIARKKDAHQCFRYCEFYLVAPEIFDDKVMGEARRLLAGAAKSAKGDATAEARVAFLEKGLRHAELTIAAQRALEAIKTTQDVTAYAKAMNDLDDFRASVEADNIANMNWLYCWEARHWDNRSLTKPMTAPSGGKQLPGPWKFMWDADNTGEKNNWQNGEFDVSKWHDIEVDKCWEKQPVGRIWATEHGGKQYDGFAWYRTDFKVPSADTGRTVELIFGAVDESCDIWLNGQKILERPYPCQGDLNSWEKPFNVDISEFVRFDGVNTLAVRVGDKVGEGGIWKPVWLRIR